MSTVTLNARGRVAKAKTVSVPSARRYITMTVGCGIPLLSLALAKLGGDCLGDRRLVLGLSFVGLCCTVLGVSLSHLAWAMRDITRSNWWQSWCLAVAIDCSLVCCELAGVAGYDGWVMRAVMLAVTAASMVLNCWAFLRHK